MSPINTAIILVIIAAIIFAIRKVLKTKGCGCGCDSCHSSCSCTDTKEIK